MSADQSRSSEPLGKKLKTSDDGKHDTDPMTESINDIPGRFKRKHDNILLLPVEQLLRKLLLDYREVLLTNQGLETLEIWFVGGWVRDKLLGIQTMDIDAALSNLTGMQFGQGLETYYNSQRAQYTAEAEKLGVSPIFKLYKVDKKPEKSKHLETATAHIFGLEVDFVNLRGETYTEDSRNPQIFPATAEEDALRRDATVNALFYDIAEDKIEDFTKTGLQDMATGIMRTPMDPKQTFLDDPLRILRLIRFASRLGYVIDSQTAAAMRDPSIHAALDTKISRERVGIEVGKMMTGRDPVMALQLIHDTGLYTTVFLGTDSETTRALEQELHRTPSTVSWPEQYPRSYNLIEDLMTRSSHLGDLARSQKCNQELWLLTAYSPTSIIRSTRTKQIVQDATNAMKLAHGLPRLLGDSLKNMDDVRSKVDLVAKHTSENKGQLARSEIGMAIRTWGGTWRLQLLFTFLSNSIYPIAGHKAGERPDLGDRTTELYDAFLTYIRTHGLEDVCVMVPILNGGDIKSILKLKKVGPFMTTIVTAIAKWQIDNPSASKLEASKWLLSQKDTFEIS